MFASITDYFLPAGFVGSPDLRRRARIIVNTVLLTSLFSFNFISFSTAQMLSRILSCELLHTVTRG